MLTVSDIIGRFGTATEFGRVCGFDVNPGQRGSDMKNRNSIPPRYWQQIVSRASELGLDGVTYEALAAAHAAQPASDQREVA